MEQDRIQLNLSRRDAATLGVILSQAIDASTPGGDDTGMLVEPYLSTARRLNVRLMKLCGIWKETAVSEEAA